MTRFRPSDPVTLVRNFGRSCCDCCLLRPRCGAPRWLSWLSIRLFISAQVLMSGSWVWALHWALSWPWSLLQKKKKRRPRWFPSFKKRNRVTPVTSQCKQQEQMRVTTPSQINLSFVPSQLEILQTTSEVTIVLIYKYLLLSHLLWYIHQIISEMRMLDYYLTLSASLQTVLLSLFLSRKTPGSAVWLHCLHWTWEVHCLIARLPQTLAFPFGGFPVGKKCHTQTSVSTLSLVVALLLLLAI